MEKFNVLLYGKSCGVINYPGKSSHFNYDPDYDGPLLSLSFLRYKRNSKAHNWVANMFPERSETLARYSQAHGVRGDIHSITLASRVGFDLPGAVEINHNATGLEHGSVAVAFTERELSDSDMEAMLNDISLSGESFLVSGYQRKFALTRIGDTWRTASGRSLTTHILKPAMKSIGNDQPELEEFSQRVAEMSGFSTAETQAVRFGDATVLISTRFDRDSEGNGVHVEDLCQAMGMPAERKYDAGSKLLPTSAIVRFVQEQTGQGEDFVRRLALQSALLATDGHLKNFAVIHPKDGSRPLLSPLYDLNSFAVYDAQHHGDEATLAIPIHEARDARAVKRSDWAALATVSGLNPDRIVQQVSNVYLNVAESLSKAARDFESPLVRQTASILERASEDFAAEYAGESEPASVRMSDIVREEDSRSGEVVVHTHERNGKTIAEHTRRAPQRKE